MGEWRRRTVAWRLTENVEHRTASLRRHSVEKIASELAQGRRALAASIRDAVNGNAPRPVKVSASTAVCIKDLLVVSFNW